MKLSILTPTFNRCECLNRTYQSLKNQTNVNFEWIIIDDGSTDGTKELIDEIIGQEKQFKIYYYYQENSGKCVAINHGVDKVLGEYVLILDSDDYLTEDAVDSIYDWIKDVEGLSDIVGVAGLRGWATNDQAIGGFIKKDYIDCTNVQRKKNGLSGDKAEVYKTEILKKYPFPKFENEKFLSEGCVWDKIASDGYKLRWYNKIIYKCEYLPGGLTKSLNNEVYLKNFQGYTYYVKVYVSARRGLSALNLIGQYYIIAKKKNLKRKQIRQNLQVGNFKLFIGRIVNFANRIRKSFKKS